MKEHCYYVYMLTNTARHPIYTGVTNSVLSRNLQHKAKTNPDGYTAQYKLTRLVYYEHHQYVHNAIRREKQLKNWSRKRKIALIELLNPKWDDLSRDWGTASDFDAALGTLYKKNKTKIPPLRREARLRSG